MATTATGDGGRYSPLATPTRSSLRRDGRGAPSTPNSVRFFGITHEDDEEHTDNVGPFRGRSPIAIKQAIFSKYFNEFTAYPLLLPHTRGTSRGNRSVRSAPTTPLSKHTDHSTAGAPWTLLSTTNVPSEWESPWPRWAVGRRQANDDPEDDGHQYPSNPFYSATRPVTSDGKPTSHLKAFEALLSKRWTRQEVEQAHARGFFRRLLPQLGVDRLQASAALLLAACARLYPPLLLPLAQGLCSVLPALISSPSQDARQAGLCLLGLTWRAAISCGPSQLATQILEAPKLLAALCARLTAGDFDALWAVREVAADPRGAAALERCGALRGVCRALLRVVAAAKNAAGGNDSGGDGSGDDSGVEEAGEERRAVKGKAGAGAGRGRRGGQPAAQQQQRQRVWRSTGASSPPSVSRGGCKAGTSAPAPADAGAGAPAGRLGVTEGGGEVERAAEGILVADCLAALTSVLSATVLMCKRYRVPERLVALLLHTVPEEAKEDDDHDDDHHEAAAAVAGAGPGAGLGSGSGKGAGNGSGAAKVPRLALPGSRPPEAVAAADGTAPGSKGGTDGGGTKEKSSRGSTGSTGSSSSSGSRSTGSSSSSSGSGSNSLGSSKSGAGGGSAGSGSGRNRSAGSGGGSGGGGDGDGGGEAEGDPEEAEGEEQGTRRRWGAVRKSRLQLQEALLRCLYSLASCGQGQEPQKAVQEALRDAGDPAMQRLALVLKERHRMEGCNAAAYLLWLCAAGDFSSFEGSELNVLRSRMGAEAPPPPPPGSGGGGGGGERNSGFGVVPTVSELLLRHLAGWQDIELVDCVPAVRTTVPPPLTPPTPPPAAAASCSAGALDGAAAAGGLGGGGGSSRTASAFGTMLAGGGGGGAGSGVGSSHHPVVAAHAASLCGGSGSDGVLRIGSTTVSVPQAPPPDGTAPDGDETIPRGPPQLRVMGSTGVLLTPRDGKAGQASTVSPQRYSSDSSDEGDAGGGGGGGSGGGEGGSSGGDAGRPDASGFTADPLGNTQDLDLIDSSVELTGKEQIMRMIKEAGAALLDGHSQPEDLTARQDDPEALPPDAAAAAAGSPSRVADGDGGDGAVYGSDGPPPPEPGVASPPSAASDDAPGTGSSPDGAPDDNSPPPTEPPGPLDVTGGGAAGGSAVPYVVRRPAALALPLASPPRRRQPQIVPSTATWLGAVRHARGGGPYSRRSRVPPPSEVQELLAGCAGLLSAVALSASGCRAICGPPELLPYLASLLDLPMDLPDSTAAAALNDSCLDLRLQLLALLTNLSMHPEGAAAIAATAAGGSSQLGTPQGAAATLAEILYGTALLSCEMISSSPTSWSTGLRLLEPCFTIMANIHRCPSVQLTVSPEPGSNKPRDSYSLAVRALSMALPASMGLADRTRLRAAAARMLDSAVAAYEGVGRNVPPVTVPELLLLLTGGRSVPAVAGAEERGGGSGGAEGAASAAAAATAAAGALWQLLAGGMVHPEVVAVPLQGPLVAILRNQREGDPELRRLALGLVSCLTRSPLVARRLWTSPVVPAVLRAHALAVEWARKDEGSWQPVEETARAVCQQLCRACHREDRGSVSDTDKRVDKWGLAERMLAQLKSKLEFDYDEEAIMLVPMEE